MTQHEYTDQGNKKNGGGCTALGGLRNKRGGKNILKENMGYKNFMVTIY